MKDFYDLFRLAGTMESDGATLARAFRATFERRGTAFPEAKPVAHRRVSQGVSREPDR